MTADLIADSFEREFEMKRRTSSSTTEDCQEEPSTFYKKLKKSSPLQQHELNSRILERECLVVHAFLYVLGQAVESNELAVIHKIISRANFDKLSKMSGLIIANLALQMHSHSGSLGMSVVYGMIEKLNDHSGVREVFSTLISGVLEKNRFLLATSSLDASLLFKKLLFFATLLHLRPRLTREDMGVLHAHVINDAFV